MTCVGEVLVLARASKREELPFYSMLLFCHRHELYHDTHALILIRI